MLRVTWTHFLMSDERYWDMAGVLFGGIGAFALLGQLLSELNRDGESTLSMSFLFGYVVVFLFWLLYGLRFKRPAIIWTNAICLGLQSIIALVVLS
ncbi:hypothetical protein [Pseudoalteromonas luteoviolacea]|uniref:Iron transporter n=1 Tax=Pseudoalteromonas luteoviolacea S4054 TaxID=1129367 RepID=A0A0F6ADG2_9GAMM|nr:hypothetical protein [Pseudoalteromonas luteoviolacea]AOT06808.1 hypothetical protein S4054249_02485 [Pseudoalteromonas luteoviolacea]AOT11726.1 hypothetical protein S40542_02485 [Pseudoalteromonas luteoviolacea]AOT16638.1 hypothetical protein S4054_02485 [Pseudoalteromonas luteoviolacea]KKE83836.1 hypothetical protein N479_12115 [Pseudoalteromonas luteoviolacea S4054]KZN74084.1 hypothetical protein N481_10245 [Pseudoalteromonas luteoviolacea S4047-1]